MTSTTRETMSLYSDLRKEYLAEWRIWYKMIYSCEHNEIYYVETEVCDDWKGEQGFINWLDDLGPRPSAEHVLNRINKLANYEPGNVEWCSKEKSMSTLRLDHTEYGHWRRIAMANGIHAECFRRRVKEFGWTYEQASSIPIENGKRLKQRLV